MIKIGGPGQKKCPLLLRNIKFQWKTTTKVQVLQKHITKVQNNLKLKRLLTRFEMSRKCGINMENF